MGRAPKNRIADVATALKISPWRAIGRHSRHVLPRQSMRTVGWHAASLGMAVSFPHPSEAGMQHFPLSHMNERPSSRQEKWRQFIPTDMCLLAIRERDMMTWLTSNGSPFILAVGMCGRAFVPATPPFPPAITRGKPSR